MTRDLVMTLEELVRSRGPRSQAYKQYCELKGRVEMLEHLEEYLQTILQDIPYKDKNMAPEKEIMCHIINLRSKIDLLQGKVDHRLGME
jgi:hypothetical protein